jgi:phage terminase large subunit-like protein
MVRSWSTACLDWEERILSGRSLVPDLPLFRDEADRALRIFKRLRVPDIIGQPTLGEACGAWFFPIVEAMFGAYDPETNRRMIQEFFFLVPKKNSKSSNGGAIMITAAIMNRRPEAEFHFIAPTIKIANISFKQAVGTIRLDPELHKLFHVQRHLRTITHRLNGTTLQILAADTDIVTGGKAVGTMIDETHQFARKSNAADIFLEIRGALSSRPDGFLFQTTTQSKDAPAGQFKTELKQARDVRDGKIEAPLLPILYEHPTALIEDDSWRERRFWQVVNPNLGRSLEPEFLQRELEKAEREGPQAMVLFASQHFNIEIGLRMHADRWVGADHWEAAAAPALSLDDILERSEVLTVGIDGGGLDDLLGLAVLGRCRKTRDWLLWARAWAQTDVLERRKEIAERLRDFALAGDLVICKEPTQDVDEVAAIVARVADAGLLPPRFGVGLDPVGVAAIIDALAAQGIESEANGGPVCAVYQGYKLSGAVWGMERKLKDGTLRHAGQPMMAWCVGNATAEQKGNAVLITKQAAGKAKIDPLVAAFNAFSLMSRVPEAAGPTVIPADYRISI